VTVFGAGADPVGSSKEPLQVRGAAWAVAAAIIEARDDKIIKEVLNIHGSEKKARIAAEGGLAGSEHSRRRLVSPATVVIAKSHVKSVPTMLSAMLIEYFREAFMAKRVALKNRRREGLVV
jgi:hypothetical protein